MRQNVVKTALILAALGTSLPAQAKSLNTTMVTISCTDYLALSKAARLVAYREIARLALHRGEIASSKIELVQGSLVAPIDESDGASADLAIAALALQASCQHDMSQTASEALLHSINMP